MTTLVGGMAQFMWQGRPWSESSLVGAHAEIEKNVVFRSLAKELDGQLAAKGMADAAVAILCPGGVQAVDAYYRGNGRELRKLVSASEIRILDGWLTSEGRRCAERRVALDPSRHGAAASTKDALETLGEELERCVVPEAISRIATRLVELHVGPNITDRA